MQPVYLYILISSLVFPLLFTVFVKDFIVYWKAISISTLTVAFLFLFWDSIFTEIGIWGFNSDYCVGVFFFGMPLEEGLFFLIIPFCSLFIHFILKSTAPDFRLNQKVTLILTISLIVLTFLLAVVNSSRYYTSVNFGSLCVVLLLGLFFYKNELRRFYLSFLIILLPFFIVNGILTGTFLDAPIVWYDNSHNLGIRLFTIPVEDVGYAFSMLFLNLILFESLKALFYKR